jgi:hypothetical protein
VQSLPPRFGELNEALVGCHRVNTVDSLQSVDPEPERLRNSSSNSVFHISVNYLTRYFLTSLLYFENCDKSTLFRKL